MAVGGVSNGYIFDVLKNKLKVKKFLDVFSADTIPTRTLRAKEGDKVCIVNLSKLDEIGTHFITLHIRPKDIIIYDSLDLNLKIFSPTLWNHLRRGKKRLVNGIGRQLQPEDSQFCGFYCIYFTLLISEDQFSNRKGLVRFKKNPVKKNDDIVMRNIKTLLLNNCDDNMDE